jgi:multiple sugar transport system ATP-binding protein
MNLITGSWRDGSLVLDDGAVLPVDPALAPGRDAKLTLGVRPDHIEVVTEGSQGVAARVLSLEPTGAETLVMAELAGAAITIVTRERLALRPGDPIRLRPVPARQLYFDAAGRRISA